MAFVLKGRELIATEALQAGELASLVSLAVRRPLTINGVRLRAHELQRLADRAESTGEPVWVGESADGDAGHHRDELFILPSATPIAPEWPAAFGAHLIDDTNTMQESVNQIGGAAAAGPRGGRISDSTRAHREKVLAHATARLSDIDHLTDPEEIAGRFRNFLKIEDERLRMAHRFGASGRWTAEARTFVLDRVVERAFRAAAWPGEGGEFLGRAKNGCAVIATGGYGRGELAPYSDIDLLFLHTGRRAAQMRQLIERVLRLLWDAGLTVGHSFRTAGETTAAARGDAHLQTALVSTRLLAGNGALYDCLTVALERERRKRAATFIEAVKHEHAERYQKHGDSVCLQEPNVKESAGGLRDLHTALWVAYWKYGCQTLEALRAHDHISDEERRSAERAYDFLLRVRYEAHLQTGRKTDRIALDLQPAIAQTFGYVSEESLLASEKLMRDYYRRARELNIFCETVLGRAAEAESAGRSRWFNWQRSTARLAEPFSISDGRLQLESDSAAFKKNPLLMFEAFALAQAADVPLSHNLKEAIHRSLRAVNRAFCASEEAAVAFLKLLRRRGRVGRALRLMHETGFLGRYLPEFGRISLLIQHDLYHHYTVDEHTLRAIDALDELYASQDKQRAHLRAAFDEVEDHGVLYFSVLLHDIGKGQGRGHIPRGVEIARRVCERMKVGAAESAKINLLVKYHTTMTQIAQRRDLREPRVALDFAAQMENVDVLRMLLLLSYGDLNGVGPGVWSEWKGTLLWDLYERTRVVLTGHNPEDEHDDAEETLARLKEEVMRALGDKVPPSEVERHFALLPDRYARSTSAAQIAEHLRLIEKLKTEVVSTHWQQKGRAATELTVCTLDRHGLFADLAGTLTAQGVEILGAELNTREDGIAIDAFIIRETTTHHGISDYKLPKIEKALLAAVRGEQDVAAMVEKW
ncbi:MAG TPA: [protein-PII] uridylyltransferase, partial [Pyrinomonadaceae bacterium]|nr:[protein-PII] uridylyltransferase [Pyrinomonadaceae bacterium]